MSPISLILPALTVISLFFYIFYAERAWLPQKGTTEWITRSVASKRMSADIKFDIKWKDIIIFAAITLVYGALLVLSNFTTAAENIVPIVCTGLFAGIVYLIAHLLFKNRVAALFAAAMACADLFLLKTFSADYALIILLAIFVFMTLMSADNFVYLIFAGIALGVAVFFDAGCAVFTLLALFCAIVTSHNCKSAKPLLVYVLFALVLPVVVCCGLSFAFYGEIFIVHLLTSFVPPVFLSIEYCVIAAVCLIIVIIHIFKDKSFSALFISIGLILTGLLAFSGINLIPLFAGLAIAYPASIIIKRGRAHHKVFCFIFGALMLLPVVLCAVFTVLSTYII